MPLVHIHVVEGRPSADRLRELADTVQEVMREHFAAPDGDRYQLITEHKEGHIIVEDSGLGFTRTADVVLIQIFQQGRDADQKQVAFRELAARLERRDLVGPDDLVVSVATNEREDWSFGRGVAQFVVGAL